jgi:hypothetical protein
MGKSNKKGGEAEQIVVPPVPPPQTLKEDVVVRGIKLFDIGYTNVMFGIPALFMATFLDKHVYSKINIGHAKTDQDKNTLTLLVETMLCLTISGITAYIMRNLLQKIPFPFENVYGFQHMRVMEVRSGAVIAMILLWFSPALLSKIKYLQLKFSASF